MATKDRCPHECGTETSHLICICVKCGEAYTNREHVGHEGRSQQEESCNAGPTRNIPAEEMEAVIEENEGHDGRSSSPAPHGNCNRDGCYGALELVDSFTEGGKFLQCAKCRVPYSINREPEAPLPSSMAPHDKTQGDVMTSSNSNWPIGKPNSLTTREQVATLGARLKACSATRNDLNLESYWHALAEESISYVYEIFKTDALEERQDAARQPSPAPRRTKFFIDTEFIESGPSRPIDLLSIGIVCEDGQTFYAVNEGAVLANANAWVYENVIPHLGGPKLPREEIRLAIKQFVGDCKPEFWGYYADYDWVVFCQIFGAMIDLPKGWPMYCRDIKQLCADRGDPQLPEQDSTEHNALNDARWNLQAYNFLREGAPLPAPSLTRDPILALHCGKCGRKFPAICACDEIEGIHVCTPVQGKCVRAKVPLPAPSLEERTRHYFEQVDPNDCMGSQDCKHVCPLLESSTQGGKMNNAQIKHMVERFLQWKLPDSFNPDGGISFKRTFNENTSYPMRHEPVGTNLFDATQTEAMIRHITEGIPAEPESLEWTKRTLQDCIRMGMEKDKQIRNLEKKLDKKSVE